LGVLLCNLEQAMADARYRHLDSRLDQGVLVITLTAPGLQGEELCRAVGRELQAVVQDTGLGRVVLDFGKVKFLTSLGIQALLNFRRHLVPRKGQLLLCNLLPSVADVLVTTRVASASESDVIPFRLAPDVATAVKHLMGT
jgi:anti-anti-sigma factor